ncbi:MAG: cob(I)yrinic acid a,c-diamide adenosyltransferase [Candidatus Pacebacteria bacterium]|nr:cob(I)yrinic acid a,c-diamide adenosyltransferase [Candidatus Paceibacterota bacterium]MBP9851143.1 cob(I)yrinic acid a,c-diamide adenosyltransferase [Candidatus Paceibacterota bacterium]
MLYTRKGDGGTTKLFNCKQGQRISKSDFIFDVLGGLDELNSTLGYTKTLTRTSGDTIITSKGKIPYEQILEKFQEHLFCIQAELGGSEVRIKKDSVNYLEYIIYEIETVLPPITSFVIPGGASSGAYLDVARATARRVERQFVTLMNQRKTGVDRTGAMYLNRLSSALYAMARFANYQQGYSEKPPSYL